jgi:hypothetical protein
MHQALKVGPGNEATVCTDQPGSQSTELKGLEGLAGAGPLHCMATYHLLASSLVRLLCEPEMMRSKTETNG